MDKRTGKKTVSSRQPIAEVGLPSYTLREAIDYVMRIKRASNLKEKTIDGYIQNMNYFAEWLEERYGNVEVSAITTAMLREYILWCAEDKEYYGGHPFKSEYAAGRKGLSPASVNVRIRVLRTFFVVLSREEIIGRNPALNVSLMRQDVDTVAPLTREELQRFLKAPDQTRWSQWRDYVVLVLILDTGMRLNEICTVEKPELDFIRKQIVLPAIKNKNRKSRVLPLSTETARLLRQFIAESERHFESTYVFTTNYGDPLNEKTLQKAFDKYAKKAKLGRSVSPHVLRHNFATMAAENGMSVFHLQKLLGHAEIATTRKYVQLSAESVAEQHARFSPLTSILKNKNK